MATELGLRMERQPDDTTCGQTCLQALYRYWGDEVPLADVLREVPTLPEGGTLAVLLGTHALRRGYEVHLVTWDLEVLDPTWFRTPERLVQGLTEQERVRSSGRVKAACRAYREFVQTGGSLELRDLTLDVLRRPLRRGEPILTGLSATYLYRSSRERPDDDQPDDVRGRPVGHFVVLSGYRPESREVLVTDPLYPNELSDDHTYGVPIERLLGAIYLGALTHDANLLHVRPRKRPTAG
ncbi:MAG TPA: hypothetical protein VJP77_01420 [Planctomycetota bacterium]|nr:hypothetical protein [Planctomycetota bacterium]